MNILEKYNIDPYEYLGVQRHETSENVKKLYKQKARLLHPDKTGGKTEVEFKILYLSYKHVIANCVQTKTSTFTELKEQVKNEEEPVYSDRNIYNTNFDDQSTRDELFADDTLNLEQFEKEMKRVQGLPTSYTAENFYKQEVLDTMKTNGKFDREKFNAFFLKLKKTGKIENQLIRKVKVLPHNQSKEYVKINSYDGNIINSIDKKKLELKNQTISNDDITKLANIELDAINNLIKENRKNTGKMSRKRIKELEEKMKIAPKIEQNLTFDEMQEKILLDKQKQYEIEQKNQREYVMKNKRIFMNSIQY